jgi:hypothetical protein
MLHQPSRQKRAYLNALAAALTKFVEIELISIWAIPNDCQTYAPKPR